MLKHASYNKGHHSHEHIFHFEERNRNFVAFKSRPRGGERGKERVEIEDGGGAEDEERSKKEKKDAAR